MKGLKNYEKLKETKFTYYPKIVNYDLSEIPSKVDLEQIGRVFA